MMDEMRDGLCSGLGLIPGQKERLDIGTSICYNTEKNMSREYFHRIIFQKVLECSP